MAARRLSMLVDSGMRQRIRALWPSTRVWISGGLLCGMATLPAACLPIFQIPELPDAALDAPIPDAGMELPDDAMEITPSEVSTFSVCSNPNVLMDEALIVAATSALRAREDGEREVLLSTDGCLRFRRSMAEGALASAEFRLFTGELVRVVRSGRTVTGARFVRMARWERDADGTLSGAIDADTDRRNAGDDFAEVRTIERHGYYRVVGHNPASREVEWRMTQDRSGTPTQTTEALLEGTLEVIDRTVIDAENEACGDTYSFPECVSMSRSCEPEQVAMLDEAMASALARGVTCMATGAGDQTSETDTWQRLQALKDLWTKQHDWGCMPAECTCAHWSDGYEDGPGAADRIEIAIDQWVTAGASVQQSTLFHEFMHGVVGAHLDVVTNTTFPPGRQGVLMRRYADRVDACQAFCFGSRPTACSCATCLDRRVCDEPCAGLPSCTEYGPAPDGSGTIAVMSAAVGAACVTTTDENGYDEEQATWFATMRDCQGTCPPTGGVCRSYSRSCSPSCE